MADRLQASAGTSKQNINLDPNDSELLLRIFESADISDIDELYSSDEEEIAHDFCNKRKLVRIGADTVNTHTYELPEEDQDDTLEEGTEEADNEEVTSSYVVTERKNIRWRHQPIIPFDVRFEPHEDPDIAEIPAPINYLTKYIPSSLYEIMAEKTNMYALQKGVSSFQPATANEIQILFGLHIAIGGLKFPRLRMYWDDTFGLPLFIENMARNRFFQLRNNLHIVNVLERPENCKDRFFKVRPIYEAVRKRCLELSLEKVLCIDEQMIPFRGKLNIKQYVKGKPCPWGIKVFLLCGKSGLAYDFILYQGSTTELDSNVQKLYNFGPAVVLHLCERIVNSGHELYYDNYFSSYSLLQILKSRGIYAGGTVRINRFGNPPLINDKDGRKKERGYSEEVSSLDGDVVVVKWLDNKGVVLASNFVGIGEQDKVKRWEKKNGEMVDIARPEIVKRYNHGMGGVDLLDQLIALYRIFIRSKKWTLRMIFHALDLAVVNSWLEYRGDAQKFGVRKPVDLLEFRFQVTEALIRCGKPVLGGKRGRPTSSPVTSPLAVKKQRAEKRPLREIQLDTVDHLPKHDGKKEPTRCKMLNCKQRSHILCIKCSVHLCINRDRNCFAEFHEH